MPRERAGRTRRLSGAGFVVALSVSALLLAACSSSSSPSTPKSTSTAAAGASLSSLETPPTSNVSLSETGSTLLYPLFNLWAPAYEHAHPNIAITTSGTGSGTGISQAAAGTVNIGASDAYLSSGQLAQSPGLENVPLAISAQMVNYNIPGFTGTLKLSGKVLSAIYQGTITTWNDPQITAINSGVTIPAVKIVPVHRSDGSGDTFIFTTYLSDADPSGWGTKISYGTTVAFPAIASALGENGNGGMVSGCGATPGCVAYIGVSYRNQTEAAHLGEAELQNGSGNYEALTAQTVAAEAASYASSTPTSGTISLIYGKKASTGYPIINYEYAIVNTNQPNADTATAVKALLAWAMDSSSNGGSDPAFLNQVNFEALSTSAVNVAIALLNKIQ
ncbi:MAG: phosphate ABC transporter substrate-binding protein PstS [Acidimicrobiales bacterium]